MIRVSNILIGMPMNTLLWLYLSTFHPAIFFTLYASK
jgi:hypothetical protein